MRERFGITMIAGAERLKKQKVLQYGFDQLPSHGLLRNYTEKEIQHLIKVLIAEGYLGLTEGQYPVVRLLPGAAPVIKEDKRFFIRNW